MNTVLEAAILDILDARAGEDPLYDYRICEISAALKDRGLDISKRQLIIALVELIERGNVIQTVFNTGTAADQKIEEFFALNVPIEQQLLTPRGGIRRQMEQEMRDAGGVVTFRQCRCPDDSIHRWTLEIHTRLVSRANA